MRFLRNLFQRQRRSLSEKQVNYLSTNTDDLENKRPDSSHTGAELVYVTPPTESEMNEIEEFVRRKCGHDIEIKSSQDDSLISGFTLRIGTHVYDWSQKGRSRQLADRLLERQKVFSPSEKDIISILRSEISDFDIEADDKEIGFVKTIGDGIAVVSGIDHAQYGEIVIFENGVKGMVQDIRTNEIGVILFGSEHEIKQDTKVGRTGRRAGIPVGREFLGRVIDALGAPIDGLGEIKSEGYRPIENEAPGIVDRKQVSVPLQTGILSIDSMFPIGRGQRELIIGDRQTGKTSIAIDTIINQKDKGVICIYCAIGQKASTVARLVNNLKSHDAMSYTCVVNACASDSAPLQYVAPYSATALAEYFMYQGKDVLIVYDDLTKHAAAYRAISLLLGRPPGREAYPGDVFYLHSRLLERSSRLTPEAGGGSITALPVIETQYGDISAYIPTNVISITDGQICLESDLFNEGMRPAVNVGLSVSRVGGAAQIKATKQVAGTLKLSLAQYRELEAFAQFASDLDEATRRELELGQRMVEVLKQGVNKPLVIEKQVVIIYAGTKGYLNDVAVKDVVRFENELHAFIEQKYSNILDAIKSSQKIDDNTESQLKAALEEFKTVFNAN